MNAKKSLVALLAVLALALAVGPATVAATDGGAQASAKKSKGKKKSKACKGKKGKGKKGKGTKNKGSKSASASAKKKGKKNKSRNCGKGKGGSAGGSKLANGRYVDPKTELKFKVSGGGGKIQLEQIAFPSGCPIALAFGSGDSVPLKTSKGQAVAKQTFTIAGGSVTTLSWSVGIDPESLRYSLDYTLMWEIPSTDPENPPVRCDDRGKDTGRLER